MLDVRVDTVLRRICTPTGAVYGLREVLPAGWAFTDPRSRQTWAFRLEKRGRRFEPIAILGPTDMVTAIGRAWIRACERGGIDPRPPEMRELPPSARARARAVWDAARTVDSLMPPAH